MSKSVTLERRHPLRPDRARELVEALVGQGSADNPRLRTGEDARAEPDRDRILAELRSHATKWEAHTARNGAVGREYYRGEMGSGGSFTIVHTPGEKRVEVRLTYRGDTRVDVALVDGKPQPFHGPWRYTADSLAGFLSSDQAPERAPWPSESEPQSGGSASNGKDK